MGLGIGTLITTGAGLVKSWLDGKQEEQKDKRDLKRIRVEAEKKLDVQTQGVVAQIDKQMTGNSKWMQRISFFVFLIPSVLVFVYPPAIPHIEEGFATLETMPVWYQYALGGMLIAVWGYKSILNTVLQRKMNKIIDKLI